MCGIAGVIDLAGRSAAPPGTLRRMADAIAHRGPDDDGYLDLPHLGLANRRLSIVGLADGKQPIANEDRSVWCVFNGEFFEYPEKRRRTGGQGPPVPHPHGHGAAPPPVGGPRRGAVRPPEGAVRLLRVRHPAERAGPGPRPVRHLPLVLDGPPARRDDVPAVRLGGPGPARLRDGPGRAGPARPEPRVHVLRRAGADDVLQGREPAPAGPLPAGAARRTIRRSRSGPTGSWTSRTAGTRRTRPSARPSPSTSGCSSSRSSGGCGRTCRSSRTCPAASIQSVVAAVASKVLGRPIPTFTVAVRAKGFDESPEAALVARHIGTTPIVADYSHAEVRDTYPDLVGGGRGPGGGHVGRGAVAAGPVGPRARVQGGPDGRRVRRVPGRLPVVQDAPADGRSSARGLATGCGSRPCGSPASRGSRCTCCGRRKTPSAGTTAGSTCTG